jgi:outer membrane protein OmpA-like peptidoglycan-associated protein
MPLQMLLFLISRRQQMKSFTTSLTFLTLLTFLCACSSVKENKKTYAGTGIGTAVGAGLGAMIGNGKGAVIGGILGAGIGGFAGSRMDKQAKELEKIAETKRTDQGLITKLKSDILFDTGKAGLRPAAIDNLKQMSDIMKNYPENILTIKGFTDNTGSETINEKLSARRAEAVKIALQNDGLTQAAIATQGMGPSHPIADNSSATGRSQNRRVEIEITVDESKLPRK